DHAHHAAGLRADAPGNVPPALSRRPARPGTGGRSSGACLPGEFSRMTASASRPWPPEPLAMVFDPTDVETIRAQVSEFVRQQSGAPVEIGPLRRFTVGFSWVTYGFRAKWSEGGLPVERDLILRAGPPAGI